MGEHSSETRPYFGYEDRFLRVGAAPRTWLGIRTHQTGGGHPKVEACQRLPRGEEWHIVGIRPRQARVTWIPQGWEPSFELIDDSATITSSYAVRHLAARGRSLQPFE